MRAAYVEGWELRLKAVALYRDGSKMSQPLNAAGGESDYAEPEGEPERVAEPPVETAPPATGRRRLPDKRRGTTMKFRIASRHKFHVRTGEYPDGRLGEIFIDAHKEGATMKGFLNSFAIAVSVGLQHGVPLSQFVEAFSFTKYEPNGPVAAEGSRIKMCSSILDAVFRWLGVEYDGREDLAHEPAAADAVPPWLVESTRSVAAKFLAAVGAITPDPPKDGAIEVVSIAPPPGSYSYGEAKAAAMSAAARASGYLGDACPRCKEFKLVRRGACACCDSCGETSGCQ